jgi:CO dehydrogenase/acetyl-CoA synthase alpha subunit
MAADYTTRHNLIVNRLVEAIKLICRIIGEANENTTVKITSIEGKDHKPFHSQIRPDIWYWTNEATDDPVPEHQRILHLVEVKSCWEEFTKIRSIKKEETLLMNVGEKLISNTKKQSMECTQ